MSWSVVALLRPCTSCGEPHDGAGRCSDCRREADTARTRTRDSSRAHQGTARWTRLSARLRRSSPFCERCGSTRSLEVDHVLPVVEFPELVYCLENLRVLCRRCNRSRGHRWTREEAVVVLERLESAYRRRPTLTLREAVNVALRAAEGGEGPHAGPGQPPPVSRETRYTPPWGIATRQNVDASHIVGRTDQEVRA
ncbi:HNH endonuclease signature motif containing protein [Gordonia phthalatica]|uniref:HNH endonuclease signature motif containing protein n=1 Tax=Gordonia phthalatica TaxID=1136941 RepID=UPI0009E6E0F2